MLAQLASTRRRAIIAIVGERGALTVSELAGCFGVSSMTIRRDLEHLQRSGAIERAHGGALRPSNLPTTTVEPSFVARRTENAAAKARIAKAAAELIEQGEVVALDVGSTVVALAEVLRPRADLGVVTHNLHVVATLAWVETGPSLYVLGGHCRRNEGSLCGPHAGDELAKLWLDTAVIGVAGISSEGLFDYAPEEAEIKRQYRSRARRVVVLCDASKMGRRSLVRVAALDAVDILVTDTLPSVPLAAALAEAGVRVVVAAPDQDTSETAQQR
jgi:DeoR/GlpR family transcriptional regulator of sugar metabolism